MKIFIPILLILLIGSSTNGETGLECLDKVKDRFNASEMIKLEAVLSVYSFVFEDTEKYEVEIITSDSGLYRVQIDNDVYLFDGEIVWEYSFENNQVTKREVGPGERPFDRISFIKRFDKYYHVEIVDPCRVYKLTRIDSAAESLPDKMTLYLEDGKLWRVEYKDLNGDLNSFQIKERSFYKNLDNSLFRADFPDSTEIISLP